MFNVHQSPTSFPTVQTYTYIHFLSVVTADAHDCLCTRCACVTGDADAVAGADAGAGAVSHQITFLLPRHLLPLSTCNGFLGQVHLLEETQVVNLVSQLQLLHFVKVATTEYSHKLFSMRYFGGNNSENVLPL